MKTCETCALRDPRQPICQMFRHRINMEDFCSKHQDYVLTCDACGIKLINPT